MEEPHLPWQLLRWNQIDLVTVVLGWIGVFLSTSVNFNVLRIIRVVRLMRAARVVISIPEFYILVQLGDAGDAGDAQPMAAVDG